jgi:hypothetical protein
MTSDQTMTPLFEQLNWDTEFFGFPIGRAHLEGATTETLAAIEDEARTLGIRCLYGTVDPAEIETAYLVQTFGYHLVEVGVTFDRPPMPFPVRETKSVVREGSLDDMPLLDDAIATLAPWSRFGADPRFGPEAARRMFRAWVERAARDDDRLLTISEDPSGVTGLSTQLRGAPDRIDLMGVTTPGSGASWAMMAAFVAWAREGTVEAGPCAARNIVVFRMLNQQQFRPIRARYQYHRWLDEERGVRS